jgi:alanine dehydrogenase
MPGAVPITSTHALTNATLPYAIALADQGVAGAIQRDPGLRLGVNVAAGVVTHPAVAEGVEMDCVPVEEALEISADGPESGDIGRFEDRRHQHAEAND